MKKIIQLKNLVGICLVVFSVNPAFAEDAEVKLNSSDGSTKMIVQNKNAATVSSFDSKGNLVINGTAAVVGSEFSVGGSTFVIKNGNVGIGTLSPGYALDVAGDIKASGNFHAGLTGISTTCINALTCAVACPSGYVITGGCFSSTPMTFTGPTYNIGPNCYGYLTYGTSAIGWCCAQMSTGTMYVSVTCARLGN